MHTFLAAQSLIDTRSFARKTKDSNSQSLSLGSFCTTLTTQTTKCESGLTTLFRVISSSKRITNVKTVEVMAMRKKYYENLVVTLGLFRMCLEDKMPHNFRTEWPIPVRQILNRI